MALDELGRGLGGIAGQSTRDKQTSEPNPILPRRRRYLWPPNVPRAVTGVDSRWE
jgi:hypothetical protein